MADTDVWLLGGPIASPAATDRIPVATASGAGGYSARGEFASRDSAGLFQALGISGAPCAINVAPAASNQFGGIQVYSGGQHEMSLLAKGSTGEVNLSCGRSVGWGGNFNLFVDTVSRLRVDNGGTVAPGGDNTQDCGGPSKRWANVRAATGTIQTSDATEKEWIGAGFSPALLSAAKRIAAEIGSYKWLAAIARENDGGPAARIHFGARAQAVWSIMADEGLIDPIEEGVTPTCPYAFLCWDPVEGNPNGRFGIRPDQLAMFLIAAQEARLTALEALITEGE